MEEIDDDFKTGRNIRREWPEIAKTINENFAESGVSPSFEYELMYTNSSPVDTLDQDTGVLQASLPANTEVLINIVFTVNASGTQYAIAASGENDLVTLSPDVRLLRSAEPVDGGGDVAFAAWYDAATLSYHYSIDTDGGGKTLNSVRLTRKTLT